MAECKKWALLAFRGKHLVREMHSDDLKVLYVLGELISRADSGVITMVQAVVDDEPLRVVCTVDWLETVVLPVDEFESVCGRADV
jgi:hypothetical protein